MAIIDELSRLSGEWGVACILESDVVSNDQDTVDTGGHMVGTYIVGIGQGLVP